MGVGISVGVIEPLPVRMLVTMSMTVHALPFYFVLLRPLAPLPALVGWLTTRVCDSVDASRSRCHYLKRGGVLHVSQGCGGLLLGW